MRKLIASAIFVIWPAWIVLASVNASGTIAVTSTFQQVFPGNPTRFGCVIQNNDAANAMYVYAGPIAGATLTNSYIVPKAGGTFSCSSGIGTQTDQISVTGTATGAFYAEQW